MSEVGDRLGLEGRSVRVETAWPRPKATVAVRGIVQALARLHKRCPQEALLHAW